MEQKILSLLGPVSAEDLQYVDAYVGRDLGIFIPSVGHCGLALRQGHTHPAYSLVLFPEAGMDFLFHGAFPPGPEEYLAAAISPEIPHEEAAGEEVVSYLAIMVGPKLCEKLAAELPIPQCACWQPFFVPKSVLPLIRAFMAEAEGGGDGILLESLETAVAATLMRCLAGAGEMQGKWAGAASPGVQTAVDYIHQHYGDRLSGAQLARAAAMSPGTFSRSFRRETGKSPGQFLIGVRLEKARKLLADSGLPVTEVAMRCGFSSASHLTGCFKQHYGVTPSVFRERRNLQKKG